jgi:predicted PurR-regulated permease PerM
MPPWLPAAVAASTVVWLVVHTVWDLVDKLSGVASLAVLAGFVAIAGEPAVNRLHRRGVRRCLGALALLGGVTAAMAAFTVLTAVFVASSGRDLLDHLPGYVERVADGVTAVTGFELDTRRLTGPGGVLDTLGDRLADGALAGATRTLTGIGQWFVICLFAFYFLVDGPRFRRHVCSLLPAGRQQRFLDTWELAMVKTSNYLVLRLVLAAISGAVHAVAFAATGVPYAVPMGLWVGVVSQLIPIIGTYLAAGLPVVLALGAGDVRGAVAVVVIATVYQQFENYVLTPPLTHRAVDLHPVFAFASVLVGGTLFGAFGAIVAIPVAATVAAVVSSVSDLRRHELTDHRLLGVDTGPGSGRRPGRRPSRRPGVDGTGPGNSGADTGT